jgi:hypothetical protein
MVDGIRDGCKCEGLKRKKAELSWRIGRGRIIITTPLSIFVKTLELFCRAANLVWSLNVLIVEKRVSRIISGSAGSSF